ncbi:MAG: methyltransferase domain-containing protein [Planctomycetota bacterium]|nr:methyltransferase domain-containing protein [Planctomycetota bacterium]
MQRAWLDRLVSPRTGAAFDIDAVRVADDEVVEAFLVSSDEREVWPVVAGVAVLPRALRPHLRTQGNVYLRTPVNDPRLGRFLLGRAGSGYVVVAFDDVVASYRDLVVDPPAGYDTSPDPEHVTLAELLDTINAVGIGAVVGTRVGRSVFRLAARLGAALGFDRSMACTRRARNVAVTVEDFFLPGPRDGDRKPILVDLSRLQRTGADFVVAEPSALPLATGALDVVVVDARDGLAAWDDPVAVTNEAERVTRSGGHVIWHEALALPDAVVAAAGPWRASVRV